MDQLNPLLQLTPLLFGLLGSTHCVGMCGGIVGAVVLGLPVEVRSSKLRLITYMAAFNLGRLTTYLAGGVAAGVAGEQLTRQLGSGLGHNLMQGITVALLVITGLYLLDLLPGYARLERLGAPLWRWLEPARRGLIPPRSPLHILALGLIWGLLPCGLVYTALLWSAASGNPTSGGLTMLWFGIGTLPGMVATGVFLGVIRNQVVDRNFRRGAGWALIILGMVGATLLATGHGGHGDHTHADHAAHATTGESAPAAEHAAPADHSTTHDPATEHQHQ